MQFLYQGLVWGFMLALVPVLIHLINMMRHRRIRWAAMDFLLKSYKKHRKWVWLKQLLLLLSRMLAIALLVAMLAQWITRGQWLDIVGGKVTHHYVLLDDSGSMAEDYGSSSAFEAASRFLQRLAVSCADEAVPQRFTLVRFSRAARSESSDARVADFNAEPVDSEFPKRMEAMRHSFELTQAAVGPEPALRLVSDLIREGEDENRVVYLVSDFRQWQWNQAARLQASIKELARHDVKLELIQSVGRQQPNLALVSVRPSSETRAADVPVFVDIAIRNTSSRSVENVSVKIHTQFYEPELAGDARQPEPNVEDLPLLLIDRIDPGKTVTRRVQVYFPQAGRHVVHVELPSDGLETDNHRWCVIDFPESEPVLILDGDPAQQNAQFLSAIFQPGTHAKTGIAPEIKPVVFLRDASRQQLQRYYTIYLCDLPRLDERAVRNLEEYVAAGGGVVFFAGDEWSIAGHNRGLYRGGEGLFPLPLERDDLLVPDELRPGPDVVLAVEDHPVFRELAQGANPLIHAVRVERYLRPPSTWKPVAAPSVRVVARLRNGQPLVVEKSYGRGRVMAFLTSFAPYWNDLALNATVVIALRLEAYLGAARRPLDERTVGTTLPLTFSAEEYDPAVRWFLPAEPGAPSELIERQASESPSAPGMLVATLPAANTERAGVYEVWLRRKDGKLDARRFAVNVDPPEAETATAESKDVLAQLDMVDAEWYRADAFAATEIRSAGFNRSLFLMALLLLLLIAEQWLAYSASYHPKGVPS